MKIIRYAKASDLTMPIYPDFKTSGRKTPTNIMIA